MKVLHYGLRCVSEVYPFRKVLQNCFKSVLKFHSTYIFVERWKFSQKCILILPKDRGLVKKRYWFCQEVEI